MMRRLLLLTGGIIVAGMLFAQPPNDNCSGAILIPLGEDEETAVRVNGDTRGSVGMGDASVPNVCSGSWFHDDVWFKIPVDGDIPGAGITIRCYFRDLDDTGFDVPAVGMAVYTECTMQAVPLACFSTADPEQRTLSPVACRFENVDTLYVRVWSGVSPKDDEGTFRIAAFKTPDDTGAVVLWEETFENGFDAGWTTFGACGTKPDSNHLAVWRVLSDGFLEAGAYTGSVFINSRTACDNAVGVNSDLHDSGGTTGSSGSGDCTTNFGSESQYVLVSPVIYTGEWDVTGISLLWSQAVRHFFSTYFVSFRTREAGGDWSDWTNIQVNEDLVTNDPVIQDSRREFLPGATMGDSLQLRFIYNANYYMWVIDDIQLIETEAHNMRAQSNFFTIQNPIQTIVGQGVPWYPQIDILNAGAAAQTNVTFNCMITNELGEVVYDETLNIGDVEASTLVENEETTIPTTVDLSGEIGTYMVTYTVESDSATLETDFDPTDNVVSFNCFVDMNTLALERGATRSLAPAQSNYNDPSTPPSYVIGNYFHLPNGSDREFESVTFGLANNEELAGQSISIRLYEWNDANDDATVQASERTIIAFNEYVVDPADGQMITLMLENFNEPGEPVYLKDATSYLLMLQWDSPGPNAALFVLASQEFDYSAAIFISGLMGTPHYGPILGLAADGNNEGVDYATVGFGRHIIPVMRMNTKVRVSAKNTLPDNNIVKLYPNPATDRITVDLQLDRRYNVVDVYIAGMDGKVIKGQTLFNVQNQIIHLDCSDLASGGYLLYVRTEAGRKLERFVIQR